MKHGLISLFLISSISLFSQINWQSTEIATGSNLLKMTIFDDTTAIVAGLNTTLKKTIDGGLSWQDVNLPDTVLNLTGVDFFDMSFRGDTGFLVTRKLKLAETGTHDLWANTIILTSNNRGGDWQLVDYNGISDNSNNPATDVLADSSYAIEISSIEFSSAKKLFIWANWIERNGETSIKHGRIYASTDFGSTWQDELGINLGSTFIKSIKFIDGNGFIGGNKIFNISEKGAGWQDKSADFVSANAGDDTYYINNFTPVNDSIVLITTTTDGIFKYNIKSKTFEKINSFGANDVIPFSEDTILAVGTSSKTLLTYNSGLSWNPASPEQTLYAAGGILGKNAYALGKSFVYFFDINDLLADINQPKLLSEEQLTGDGFNRFVLNAKQSGLLQVYSVNGVLVHSRNYIAGSNIIDLSTYKKGIYIVRTLGEKHQNAFKILVR